MISNKIKKKTMLNSKHGKTRKAFDSVLNMIPLIGTIGLVGGMMNMFGLGSTKQSKRDTAKGVLDLVFDDYENTIREMEIVNTKQEQEIERLKMELGIVEDSLRKCASEHDAKKKKKTIKKKS